MYFDSSRTKDLANEAPGPGDYEVYVRSQGPSCTIAQTRKDSSKGTCGPGPADYDTIKNCETAPAFTMPGKRKSWQGNKLSPGPGQYFRSWLLTFLPSHKPFFSAISNILRQITSFIGSLPKSLDHHLQLLRDRETKKQLMNKHQALGHTLHQK